MLKKEKSHTPRNKSLLRGNVFQKMYQTKYNIKIKADRPHPCDYSTPRQTPWFRHESARRRTDATK